ncbi:MAG: SLC13 family permease [Pseudomonadota bacterium]
MPELIPETWHAALAIITVLGMFVLFIRESYPTEVVALGGAAFLLLLGVLPYEDALSVLSNPAPWTIGAMFVLSGALIRTGALTQLTSVVTAQGREKPKLVLAGLALFVILASAFMNNTPVVVIMIPIAIQMAGVFGSSASKFLIPLSYVAILGGMCTLIGTSTNLLVDGVARDLGLEPFTMFEITPLAVILVGFGLVYLQIMGPLLLPERSTVTEAMGKRSSKRFFTEFWIPNNSDLIGKAPHEVEAFKRDGARVVDVIRGDLSMRRVMPTLALQAGDQVVLRTNVGALLGLKENQNLMFLGDAEERETSTIEALIPPGSKLVGRTLGELRLRRRYGVYPLAVHRRNQNLGQLEEVRIRVGDTLLIEGAEEDIHRLAQDFNLAELQAPSERPYRRTKAPIVVAALAAVVILAALGIAPIFAVAVLAVAAVLLTRSIDSDEAFDAVDGRLLILIFSMLAIGAGLQASGAVELVASFVAPQLEGLPPFLVVWAIYLLTSILTELVSNNAVAVVVTPVAVALAASIGIDPRPLVVAVMVAASASFATPIGYQTNTLIYGPGGYAFTDFMKIGIPLNISIGLLASALIPMIWPLTS